MSSTRKLMASETSFALRTLVVSLCFVSRSHCKFPLHEANLDQDRERREETSKRGGLPFIYGSHPPSSIGSSHGHRDTRFPKEYQSSTGVRLWVPFTPCLGYVLILIVAIGCRILRALGVPVGDSDVVAVREKIDQAIR